MKGAGATGVDRMRRRWLAGAGAAAAAAAAYAGWRHWPARVADEAALRAAHAAALPPLAGPVPVYHLGHSLVGQDMPGMLAQVAGHRWNNQIGWGTSLKQHWTGRILGAESNGPPGYRPAFEAVDSGDYAVIVLTEMVELTAAIRWHDSGRYLGKWAERARQARPDVRVYLYETWHELDDPAGWSERIAADRPALWEGELLRPALGRGQVIHVIPGGQVMAAAARAAEAGEVPGVAGRADLFADEIHFSDLGAWLMAMTHYATIYARSPEGLPAQLAKWDGTLAGAPSDAAALALQRLVWQVVAADPLSGVREV